MLTERTCKVLEESGWAEKWLEKGKLEGKLEDARAMFAEGIKIEVISRVTELPLKRLKKELKAQ